MLSTPAPILVVDRFPVEREALLALLASLPPGAWSRPTIAGDWTVQDIAAHLVADDFGRLSSQRDGYRQPWSPHVESLKAFIDRRNAEWVIATRRLSPRVLQSLLELGGRESQALFESLDPLAPGSPVDWAGPEPAPIWLDLARELTERWHHQQQIREAVGAPLLDDETLLRPVLATFAFALVPPYRDVDADAGATVHLSIEGPSGGDWTLVRERTGWSLRVGRTASPDGSVTMDQDAAWRMYVRALSRTEIEARSTFAGDARLAGHLLDAFALIS
jgi:uncharacterized protein (TIGR03083 family)